MAKPYWRDLQFVPSAGKVKAACLECGCEMWLPPSKVGVYVRCSQACRAVWRARQRQLPKLGWHASRFIQDARKVSVKCSECQRPMWLPASKVSEYQRCGLECNSVYRSRQKDIRFRLCKTCNKPFYPRLAQLRVGQGLFCSHACNTALLEALSTPQAKRRSIERMNEMRAAGLVTYHRGDSNPYWLGGPKASARRRTESGKAAIGLRAYRLKNPDKTREWDQRRNGRKAGRLPRGTVSRIGVQQRWKCAICRCNIKNKYHVDHIIPLALGGLHVPRNIQLLCGPCNLRKNAKDPIVYMQTLGRLL